MLLNALILILLGVIGFFISGSPTALIAPGIGVILLILAFPVKKDNKTAAHIAVALTLISVIVFFITGFMRSNLIVIVMAVVTTIALIIYINDFIRRKKERELNS